MIHAVLFLFGLAIGSFLNVLSFRYRDGQFILSGRVLGGRSHCMSCGKALSWRELIPLLSFLAQGGRCRNCGHSLSFQYPLVEFLTGVVFVAVPLFFLPREMAGYGGLDFFYLPPALLAAIIFWIAVFVSLLLLAVIDYREYLVPDEIIVFLASAGILWTFFLRNADAFLLSGGTFLGDYANIFFPVRGVIYNHLFGMFIGLTVIGLIFFISRGKAIGFGDVKLLGALGLLFGWPDVVLILFLSFIIGAAVGSVLLLRKSKGMKDFVPFAPFIVISSLLVFLFGADMLRFYFAVFTPFQ